MAWAAVYILPCAGFYGAIRWADGATTPYQRIRLPARGIP